MPSGPESREPSRQPPRDARRESRRDARRAPALVLAAGLFLTALVLAACASENRGQRSPLPKPRTKHDVGNGENHARSRVFMGPVFLTGDAKLPEAKAVVVDRDGRIERVLDTVPGDEEIAARGYEPVPLPGALAVPGLHDAHVHVLGIGEARESVDLRGTTSVRELRERVRAFVEAHPALTIVRGWGWDQSLFDEKRFPTAIDLEGLTDKPIALDRVDGHAVLVNRAVLEAAGLTSATADPPGGKLLRDEGGAPTGVLVDNAVPLATRVLPAPTLDDLVRRLSAGLEAAADAGLVAVHDMAVPVRALEAYQKLDDEGRVPVRVFLYLDGTDPDALDATPRYAFSDRVRVMGIKLFTDGALGSRGAALLAPYSDDPDNTGLLLTEPAVLEARVREAHERGLQAALHAIGDRGNRVALDAIARAQRSDRSRRHRVEHAQIVHDDDFARFAALGVVASMQPTHATSDARWIEARLGKARLAGAYAWRRMLEAGVPLAFGSDAPVESERPALGLDAALTRKDAAGEPEGGFLPDPRLSLDEALHAFSAGAAYAVGREHDLGRLSPGMRFDVSVFDRDPRGDAQGWLEARAVAIVVDGEVGFELPVPSFRFSR